MEKYLHSKDCPVRLIRNGYMLTSLIIATVLALGILLSILPAVAQSVQYYRYGHIHEALQRQGCLIDEALFLELRYAKNIAAQGNEIRFTSASGRDAGFCVYGGILYRILEDGTRQPLSGTGQQVSSGRNVLKVAPYGDLPFFSTDGKQVRAALVLYEEHSRYTWTSLVEVIPLYELWQD